MIRGTLGGDHARRDALSLPLSSVVFFCCSRVFFFPLRQGKGRCSSVAFSTVVGHLIEGEERFSVEFREEDSSVWLDLYSVSRGSGVLGKVGWVAGGFRRARVVERSAAQFFFECLAFFFFGYELHVYMRASCAPLLY